MNNKKYHITALGNALVDLEFRVDEEIFDSQDIEKGVMTLIDKERHLELYTQLESNYQLEKKACGGSAANTVVTASQFGAKTFYCCKVGTDNFGHFYKKDLTDVGVDHLLNEVHHDGETGKCIVMLTDDADRTMNTYLGITSSLDKKQVIDSAIINSEYFYIEGHLMYSDEAVEAILYAKNLARENDVKVALTVSDPAVVKYARENLERVIGNDGVDILFCNFDEITDYGQGCPDKGIQDLKKKSEILVVTKGKDGATVYPYDLKEVSASAYAVEAIDTTGAGDTFAGAFLYALSENLDISTAVRLANRTAAECVAKYGPRLNKETQQNILKLFIQ